MLAVVTPGAVLSNHKRSTFRLGTDYQRKRKLFPSRLKIRYMDVCIVVDNGGIMNSKEGPFFNLGYLIIGGLFEKSAVAE